MNLSKKSVLVLKVLMDNCTKDERVYGSTIKKIANLSSGTLYPLLIKLLDMNLISCKKETKTEGIKRRHYYMITAKGQKALSNQIELLENKRAKALAKYNDIDSVLTGP